MTFINLFGNAERQVGLVKNIDRNDSSSEGNEIEEIDFSVGLEAANVVTSQSDLASLHYPVLDLDYGAHLLPSSTPGNYHLLLNKPVPWDKYVAVLDALGDAGLLQPGYVSASKKRGHTAIRLPWKRKQAIPF